MALARLAYAEIGRLNGSLLAHLEFALADIEAALPKLPKHEVATRSRLEARRLALRGVLARHPVAFDAEVSGRVASPPASPTAHAPETGA